MHDGHRARIRDKYERYGADIFEDHELLEMLLFFSIRRKNTNDIAHALIHRFGFLKSVFEADRKALASVDGVGSSTAFFLSLIGSLALRCVSTKNNKGNDKRSKLDTYPKICRYLTELFDGEDEEKMYAICLNDELRVESCERVAAGDSSEVDTTVKGILRCISNRDQSFVIIAHNHPNGVALPSGNDIESTLQLSMVFRYMDHKLIDHFVVAGERCTPILHSNDADSEKIFSEKAGGSLADRDSKEIRSVP